MVRQSLLTRLALLSLTWLFAFAVDRAVPWIEPLVPLDGQTIPAEPSGTHVTLLVRLSGLEEGVYMYEVHYTSASGPRTRIGGVEISFTGDDTTPDSTHMEMPFVAKIPHKDRGQVLIEYELFRKDEDWEVVAFRGITINVARIPLFLGAGEDGGVAEDGGMAIGECSMVVDTSPDLLATPERMLVGFVEGRGGAVLRLEDMLDRHCLLYRAVEVSECRRESGADALRSGPNQGYGLSHFPVVPEPRPLASAALVSAVGPIDAEATTPWSAWNEKIVALIVANRLCFARSEKMDFLLAIGTTHVLAGRPGYFLKFPALKAALLEYNEAVWVDMDGYMPYAPRAESRKCVPFTECWPSHLAMIFSLMKGFPNTGIFILRKSEAAIRMLDVVWSRGLLSQAQNGEQMAIQHYLLETFSQHAVGTYQGECGQASSRRNVCWMAALANGARVPHPSVLNISVSNRWCRPDEDASGLMLTCPCNPDNATDWCDDGPDGKTGGGGSCSIAWCVAGAPLFVHFGSWAFKARLPEVVTNTLWSCRMHSMLECMRKDPEEEYGPF